MAGGRGQAEIRTSVPDEGIGDVLSLVPERQSNIFRKERRGLDDGN